MDLSQLIENIIEDLKVRFKYLYFEVQGGGSDPTSLVVLTPKVRDEVMALLNKHGFSDVDVIALLESGPYHWKKSLNNEVSLRSEPSKNASLQSELNQGEFVKSFLVDGEFEYVLTEDQAGGWVDSNNLMSIENGGWKKKYFKKHSIINSILTSEDIVKNATKYSEVPYLLGGNSFSHMDCSSYTQRVFYETHQTLLPRHSWNQKEYGKEIPYEERQVGDLIFGIMKRTGTKHVGILIDRALVSHASSRMGKVVTWKLEIFSKIYKNLQIRRLVDGK